MKLKEFLIKNKETFQLVYGVALIVIIPALIVFNTIFIINKYNEAIDVLLQRQALSYGRVIYSLVKDDFNNPEILQNKINELSKRNVNMIELSVLTPVNDDFKVVSSSLKDRINKKVSFYFYNIAWMQPDNDGLATNSELLAKSEAEEDRIKKNNSDSFWLVAMPVSNEKGEKKALLAIKLSAEVVNDLAGYTRNASMFILMITVLIVVLFLAASVRLWDYVLLYKKIKEVDQMKDEFISIASHELRTPVTSIRGYVSMVLDGSMGKITSKAKDSLNMVKISSERLAGMVEDLLNVSRIEQGRLKIEPKNIDVSNIIADTVTELKVLADEKKLILKILSPSKNLPLINIDTDRFKQVLLNIIGNAIKYTPKGSVEVITEIKENGKELEIRIKDTGLGMAEEERERLFEKFYRVQNENTKEITGTGLGLWITKRIVELMKGRISVDSIKNVGTQVTIIFPIVKK